MKIHEEPATDAPLLTLDNVEKVYPNGFRAVEPLTLAIYPGEFLTLLGPSGCGKTTTLRMIGGFETPTAGRITLMGKDVTHSPPSQRSVNTVFQDYALFPHLTVEQNVGFGPTVAGASKAEVKARVAEMLGVVGLGTFASRLPSQLSGGQRQRVALARALIQKPRVLLLDEPLGALDANIRGQMQAELKEIQARIGITFVMVTHDQQEAMIVSDRIAIMEKGRLAQLGSPEELYNQPKSEFIAKFLGNTNLLQGELRASESQSEVQCGEYRLAAPPSDLGLGPVKVAFRPESVAVAEGSQGKNVFSGTVRKHVFLGNVGRIHVDVPSVGDVILEVKGCRDNAFAVGQSLSIHIPPDSIRLFPPS